MASQVKEVKKYSFNQYSSTPQLYMNKEQTEQQYQALTGQVQGGDQYLSSSQSYTRNEQLSRDSNSPMGYQSQSTERSLEQTLIKSNPSFSVASSQHSQNTSVSLGFNPIPSSLPQTLSVSPQFSQTSPGSRFGQGDQPSFQTQTTLVQPPPPPPPQFMSLDQSQSVDSLQPQDQFAPVSSFSQSFIQPRFDQNTPASQGFFQHPPPPPPPTYW